MCFSAHEAVHFGLTISSPSLCTTLALVCSFGLLFLALFLFCFLQIPLLASHRRISRLALLRAGFRWTIVRVILNCAFVDRCGRSRAGSLTFSKLGFPGSIPKSVLNSPVERLGANLTLHCHCDLVLPSWCCPRKARLCQPLLCLPQWHVLVLLPRHTHGDYSKLSDACD